MKERFDYQSIQDKPKTERRTAILEAGILDDRRFLLPPNPEIRERIRSVRENLEEFKKKHPEVVSFGFFGSNTKGYATQESDIDGSLYVDLRTAVTTWREHNPPTPTEEILNAIKLKIATEFRKLLVQKTDLTSEQVAHVTVYLVDKKTTHSILTREINIPAIEELFVLFLLQIGSGIEKYRKTVFDTLEQQGETGEKKWKIISNRLAKFENATRDDDNATREAVERRQHLYPQNLKDARHIFLKESDRKPNTNEFPKAA